MGVLEFADVWAAVCPRLSVRYPFARLMWPAGAGLAEFLVHVSNLVAAASGGACDGQQLRLRSRQTT